MSDDVDDLIREIAVKHGIAVSRDDPIMILQTINARLMEESSKAQQVQLDQYKEELESIALRWGADAKDKAEKVLTASLNASKEAMRAAMEEGAKTFAAHSKRELEPWLQKVLSASESSKVVSILNIAAACIALAAAGLALWATRH